uniref:LAGLIDADG endonuclease n=1 Tax=Leucoagaricus naucinus TaxID=34434 RepID=A0A8F5GEE0_9AGAR|nr:LAGLIDADG endonuclease [Leucoagaricus naucinus]
MCPTWSYFDILCLSTIPFSNPKTRATKRIGPHNFNILNVLIGSLLGDAFAEKHGNGTRICFQQEHSNNAYLIWFHKYVSDLGYCNILTPKILTRIGKGGKLRQFTIFKTFTYSSFNWIEEAFYFKNDDHRIKIVPHKVEEYLTPIALAVWIMEYGGAVSSGLKIATNKYKLIEVKLLCEIINRNYGLQARPCLAGVNNQYIIYIPSASMPVLAKLIGPYMHPSMYYKINSHL